MTMSSARTIAPPISDASTSSVSSTSRPSRFSSACFTRAATAASTAGRRDERRVDPVLGLGLERIELRRDLGQNREAIVLGEQSEQRLALRRLEQIRALESHADRANEVRALALVELGVSEHALRVRVAEHGGRGVQRVRPGAKLLVGVRDVEQRFRVRAGDRALIGHSSTARSASLLKMSLCAFASISRASTFSAPATAIFATCVRSSSRARLVSAPISARRRVDLTLALRLAVGLRLLDDAAGARVRLLDDAASLLARRRDQLLDLGLRAREIGPRLLGRREAGRDLASGAARSRP